MTISQLLSPLLLQNVSTTEDLSWVDNTSAVVGKAQQCFYFLRRLRGENPLKKLLVKFYRCTTASILTNCLTAWYNSCTKADKKAL